jgi:hypothetical protein
VHWRAILRLSIELKKLGLGCWIARLLNMLLGETNEAVCLFLCIENVHITYFIKKERKSCNIHERKRKVKTK